MGEFLHDKPVVPRTDEEKQAVITRLKRIEGQVRGIERMVEEDRYCIDILVQIKAINAALNKVGNTITERHIKQCISSAVKNDDGEKAIDELLKIIQHVSK